MKILYNPIYEKSQEIEYQVMKIMLDDIILTKSDYETFPAITTPNMVSGIFCETPESGKKFWSLKELTYYYAKKNSELFRIKDDNLRRLRE